MNFLNQKGKFTLYLWSITVDNWTVRIGIRQLQVILHHELVNLIGTNIKLEVNSVFYIILNYGNAYSRVAKRKSREYTFHSRVVEQESHEWLRTCLSRQLWMLRYRAKFKIDAKFLIFYDEVLNQIMCICQEKYGAGVEGKRAWNNGSCGAPKRAHNTSIEDLWAAELWARWIGIFCGLLRCQSKI